MPEISTAIIDSPLSAAFEVDEPKRTIRGLAVPYGAVATSGGQRFTFSKGSLALPAETSRVKILIGHDFTKAVGVATALEDTPEGMYVTARIAKGAAGDEALAMAAEGVWDGLSIGLGQGGKYRAVDGVNHAVTVPLMEVSITPMPSFTDARIQSVAASAVTEGKEPTMGENQAPTEGTNTTTPEAPDFSAVTDAIREGFESLALPPRETSPGAGAQFQVNEETPYRFDGIGGAHGFTEDIRDSLFSGDSVARQRLEQFMGEAFAVGTGNVGALSPTQNRPDLYVPNLQFNRPLWEMVSNGGITDRTPFTIPKFSSATNLTGAHTEGTEPTEATFAATAQTVTPGAVSGKAVLNREVLDAGGNPQVDQIIWNEMVGSYYEGVETKVKNALAAVATAETNLASAVDEALVDAVQNILTGLQFVRGGNRYTGLALDGSLFGALVNASDTTGRKLLPVNAPANSQGETSAAYDRVSIGNLTGRAAWALGSGNTAMSYLFVPASVYAWVSAPRKFTFEYQVKDVTLAIWGYSAAAVTRDSDVKPIDYTTADV